MEDDWKGYAIVTELKQPLPTQPQSVEEIWRKYDDDEVRLTEPLSERMLSLANLQKGMRVLDIATGRGEPAIRAAHRVGPSGMVLGIDTSGNMLQMARERAEREGVQNLELQVANAENLDVVAKGSFDVVLARWCLMYFDSPVQALLAARKAMKPAGTLVAAVWAEPDRVSYFTYPRSVLAKHTSIPRIDFALPGTFRLSAVPQIEQCFRDAGFAIDRIEEMEVDVMEANTGAELIAWTRAFGMTKLLCDLPVEVQKAWESDLVRESVTLQNKGTVRLGGITRIVVAR